MKSANNFFVSFLMALIVPKASFSQCPSYMTQWGHFTRGDANNSGSIDIADAQYILRWQYIGGPPPPCNEDAADVDDNGSIDGTTDANWLLNWLFYNTQPPPAPGPITPGCDCTPDEIAICSSTRTLGSTYIASKSVWFTFSPDKFRKQENLSSAYPSVVGVKSYNDWDMPTSCNPSISTIDNWQMHWNISDNKGITKRLPRHESNHCGNLGICMHERYRFKVNGDPCPECLTRDMDENFLTVFFTDNHFKLKFISDTGVNLELTPDASIDQIEVRYWWEYIGECDQNPQLVLHGIPRRIYNGVPWGTPCLDKSWDWFYPCDAPPQNNPLKLNYDLSPGDTNLFPGSDCTRWFLTQMSIGEGASIDFVFNSFGEDNTMSEYIYFPDNPGHNYQLYFINHTKCQDPTPGCNP